VKKGLTKRIKDVEDLSVLDAVKACLTLPRQQTTINLKPNLKLHYDSNIYGTFGRIMWHGMKPETVIKAKLLSYIVCVTHQKTQ